MIKKDNHLFFLILTTAPVFIKHNTQEQFQEVKMKKQQHITSGKRNWLPAAGATQAPTTFTAIR